MREGICGSLPELAPGRSRLGVGGCGGRGTDPALAGKLGAGLEIRDGSCGESVLGMRGYSGQRSSGSELHRMRGASGWWWGCAGCLVALLSGARVQAQLEDVRIDGVPDYEWHMGCFGTATGNLMGFWDRNGYPISMPLCHNLIWTT